MKSHLLKQLHCPYSGSLFSVAYAHEPKAGVIDYGIVASEAGEFPVIDGILRLQVDEYRAPLAAFVRGGERERALMTALDEVPFQGRKGAAINFSARLAYKFGQARAAGAVTALKRQFYREMTDPGRSFVDTANRVGSGRLVDWQVYRFSMPTFLPVFPLLGLLQSNDTVLDFGSGTGQASFLISRVAPDASIVCADFSFASLYLSRKYFAPRADYVCLDGDYPLPFGDRKFSYVFSSDALHCIDSRLGLSAELKRTVTDEGVIVLPHLHNRASGIDFDRSLTPGGYRALFADVHARLFPEDVLVREYFENDMLDLSRDWTDTELQGKEGLSLVATRDGDVFRRYDRLWDRYIGSMRNPILNPVYRAEPNGRGVQIRKRIGEPYCRMVPLSNGDACLPDWVSAPMASFDSDAVRALQATDHQAFRDLTRKLVVIEVPECFA